MEYTREIRFTYYKDTNKGTTERSFGSLRELLDYLADQDENEETKEEIREWIGERDA